MSRLLRPAETPNDAASRLTEERARLAPTSRRSARPEERRGARAGEALSLDDRLSVVEVNAANEKMRSDL